MICKLHRDKFNDSCDDCKNEYLLLKGFVKSNNSICSIDNNSKTEKELNKYKEFSEERAKDLYQKLFLYYVKKTENESEANKRAKNIIKLQCAKHNVRPWTWLN